MNILIGVILLLIVCVVGWYIGTSNIIRRAELKINEALSGIDIALTKRYDVLTKMLDAVKAFQKYETDTLTNIVNLRMGMTMQERSEADRNMDKLSSELRLVAENYPELKSSENYAELQKSIVDVEEHLQAARRLYNANVTAYNNYLITFPSNIVANSMGAVSKPFYEADSVKRQDVKIY